MLGDKLGDLVHRLPLVGDEVVGGNVDLGVGVPV